MKIVSVKICGLKDEAALHAAIGAGADYVGFVFVPSSKRFITPQYAERLSGSIPSTVQTVGLFVDPTDEELNIVLRATSIDIIQLHGHETPERVKQVRDLSKLPVMKAIGVAKAEDLKDLKAYEAVADMILLDAKTDDGQSGGTGQVFDWTLLKGINFKKPWILAGGLTPDNVAEAIRTTGAMIVDVSSGVEKHGEKDADLIRAFTDNAKRWR